MLQETLSELEACYDDVPEPPVRFEEWSTQPREWVARFANDADSAAGSMRALFESLPVPFFAKDTRALVDVLARIKAANHYYIRDDKRFIGFGPILTLTSLRGLEILGMLRTYARESVESSDLAIVEPDSTFGELLAAINSAKRKGILRGAFNRTSASPTEQGFRLALDLDPRTMANMPSGTTLPDSIITPTLVGARIDDPMALVRDANLCDDGTQNFLSRFDIEYQGGMYECDSCGMESGESGFESINSFVITEEIAEALEAKGFADQVRDFLGSEDGSDNWADMLESSDNAEILDRCKPSEDGIVYDSTVWSFEPDYAAIEGLEDLDWSDAARALPLLASIARAYADANTLPPIAGTLTLKAAPGGQNSSYYGGAPSLKGLFFSWDPDAGTLRTPLGASLTLQVNVQSGTVFLGLMRNGAEGITLIEPSDAQWYPIAPGHAAGEHAATLLGLHKGSASL